MNVIQRSLAAALLLAFASAAVQAQDKPADYVGADQCKVCHNKKPEGAQWTVWKTMSHAKAFESLKGEAALKIAADRKMPKPPSESPECLKCHVTGYDEAKAAAPARIKPEDGLSCENCHGPGSLHIADAKDVVAKKKTAEEIDWKAHLGVIEEALCLECHNEESPTWNPEKYTRADGSKVGFDFEQAKKLTEHPNPLKAKTE
jgi:hypothetical protein